jgi:hypothetical protein
MVHSSLIARAAKLASAGLRTQHRSRRSPLTALVPKFESSNWKLGGTTRRPSRPAVRRVGQAGAGDTGYGSLRMRSAELLVRNSQNADPQTHDCSDNGAKDRSLVSPPSGRDAERAEDRGREHKNKDADHLGSLSRQQPAGSRYNSVQCPKPRPCAVGGSSLGSGRCCCSWSSLPS